MSVKSPAAIRRLRERLVQDFNAFLRWEVSGSVVLLLATAAALLLANSDLGEQFAQFWHTEFGFAFGDTRFFQSLLHWIDDGLMAVFFFVVGLEIKREFIVGELSRPRKAILPILAAVGGMVVPALLFLAFNAGGPGEGGWGVPMATDIAFALGVLTLLGSRIPSGLKVFLTALAIADDIGAVVVIAIFYSSGIQWGWLLGGLGLLLVLVVLNAADVDSPTPYLLVAIAVWFAFLHSGVHATLAGVLVAFAIPSRARIEPLRFVDWAREKLDEISAKEVPGAHVLHSDEQQVCAMEIQEQARYIQAPLQRLEHALLPVSTFVVLPLFALANAGVSLRGYDLGALAIEPVTLGVFFGLLVGKQLGITAMSWVAVKSGLADLPAGVRWRHIYGAAWLGGIGFTMSLFVSNIAFRQEVFVAEAKLAILVTSVLAGLGGYLFLRLTCCRQPQVDEDVGSDLGEEVEAV